ncbi:hypothetical protein M8C21_016614 [Ambrosia artemisiifolia]|uniref:Protein ACCUMULATION AND REPLICATION OF CHLOROPLASTS 6, chloroplastic n=1 Tax=Ambrosia artemisiifolia TaxID=4212 RepID=A0AAD5CS60_AMBAR|nr:hypothetical protein M8C21_016614 [Ambrosia artemisiifolia]
MQSLGHLRLGICLPSLTTASPPSNPNHHHHHIPTAVTGGPTNSNSLSTTTFSASKWAHRLFSDFQFLPTTTNADSPETSNTTPPPPYTPPTTDRHVSIPIDFYKVLGAKQHIIGDGIVKCYEDRVTKPPQYGYSDDVLVSRKQILMAACETLSNPSLRKEYDDDEVDNIVVDVPWDNVPGALCVLQEGGEDELVLQIGESLLKERLPKSFKQDVLLAMALSYIEISRDAMATSPPDYIKGCELLERALKLLQEEGASSLAPDLQAQIDETLEEINPRYVLELLALPLDDEYRARRTEGLQGVRNILWAVGGGGAAAVAGGFTREDFMNEAFLRMTAVEQIELFSATPKNIPAESFEVYGVALALVAQAIMGKKPHHIEDANNLFKELQQIKVTSLSDPSLTYDVKEIRQIKDAAVKIMCAGVVVGLMTLAGLRFLPFKKGSTATHKEAGSAMTSDAVTVAEAVVEEAEEIPRMDARYAEGLVRKWQSVKSQALGPDHHLSKLPESVGGTNSHIPL